MSLAEARWTQSHRELSQLNRCQLDHSARVLQPPFGDCRQSEHQMEDTNLNGPMRGVLAGLGAWKLGGGCFSTVLIFIVLFWLLGYVQC